MMRYGLSGTWRSFTTAGGGPAAGHAWERAPPPQPASAMAIELSTTSRVGTATGMGYLPLSETASSDGAPPARRSTADHRRRLVEVVEVGGGWWRLLGHALHHPPKPPQPPPASHRPPLCDAGLEGIPRSGGPVVAPLQRRDVERNRREVVDENRPRRERPNRGHGLQITLARVADLDFARLLARLRRQIAEVIVIGLVAVHAAQERDRPSHAAASSAQLALALEAGVLGHRRPHPTQRAIPLPPR